MFHILELSARIFSTARFQIAASSPPGARLVKLGLVAVNPNQRPGQCSGSVDWIYGRSGGWSEGRISNFPLDNIKGVSTMEASTLTEELAALAIAAAAPKNKEAASAGRAVKTLANLGITLTADQMAKVPTAAAKVDRTTGDNLATALTTMLDHSLIDGDDASAAQTAVDDWKAARPTGRSSASGPRIGTSTDNPADTWLHLVVNGTPVKTTTRKAGGAISSLYDSIGAIARKEHGVTSAAWKGNLDAMKASIYSETDADLEYGNGMVIMVRFVG